MNNMNINSAIADTLDIGNTDTEKKTGLIGFYNYTVVLTYIGMWIGFLGVMLAIKDRYVGSLICLMLAGVCDMFDGTIASTKKDRTRDERTFGIQIDSLSDIICFDVLPAVWVFCVTPKISIAFTAIFVFILCGLIRLAYFNVDEANRQAATAERRQYYLGLPITSSALAIPAVYLIGEFTAIHTQTIAALALLIIGICYVLPVKLKKPSLFGEVLLVGIGAVEFCILIAEVLI